MNSRPLRDRFGFALLAAALLLYARAGQAEDWPAWRGPRGDGTSRDGHVSQSWSAESGIAWKAALPEWGTSTPAIWGDTVFVTAQQDEDLLLLSLDRRDGRLQWTQKVGQAATPRSGPKRGRQKFHQLHNLASPSPTTNGELVVAHFGNGDLAVYDFEGKLSWRRNLQEEYGTYTIWWGHANSPVLYRDLVISACMQDSLSDVGDKLAPSYLVAHELATGRERWKIARMTGAPGEQADAYTTPLLVELGTRTQLLVMGGNQLDAYDPATGKQLWSIGELVGGRTVTGPTYGDGMVFVTRGMRGPLLAFKLDDSTAPTADSLAWKFDQGTPDTPCPVLCNGLLFTVADDGIARSFDAKSGKLHWKERLGGDYKASPVAAGGRVYFLNTSGACTVVAASATFEKLATNSLADATLASPAVADGQLFIRGRQALYCIGPQDAAPRSNSLGEK